MWCELSVHDALYLEISILEILGFDCLCLIDCLYPYIFELHHDSWLYHDCIITITYFFCQLILELGPYIEELAKTGGAIQEFVNPKYVFF